MSIRTTFAGLGLAAMGLAMPIAPGEAMATKPPAPAPPVRCTAAGIQLLVPATTPAAICARFGGAVRGAVRPGESVSIELRLAANGVATALVTRTRAGKPLPPIDFNLAVSDRRFSLRDLDRLAADVAAGLRKAT